MFICSLHSLYSFCSFCSFVLGGESYGTTLHISGQLPSDKSLCHVRVRVPPGVQPIDEEEEEILQAQWSAAQPLIRTGRLAEPPPFADYDATDVNREETSDLTLFVGATAEEMKPLRLHKDVLAAHSVVVAAMLSTQHEIEIPGVSYSFVERIMQGIYKGDLLWIWVRVCCAWCAVLQQTATCGFSTSCPCSR
jgi:hypothetical protein